MPGGSDATSSRFGSAAGTCRCVLGVLRRHVDPGGGGDALTIQGGVDLAVAGDEILVQPGTYGEQIDLNKAVALRGVFGRDVTVVDAADTRAYCMPSVGNISGTLIEGLTLTGVNGGYGFCTGVAALRLIGSNTIRDCAVVDNQCPQAPVIVEGSHEIIGTVFSGNHGLGWSCGQLDPDHGSGCVRSTGSVILDGCVFEGNGASDNSILDVVEGSGVVRNSVLRDNWSSISFTGGMFVSQGGGTILLENSLLVDNRDERLFGDLVYQNGLPVLATVVGNTFARNGQFFAEAPLITAGSSFEGNVFTGAPVGLRVPEGLPVTVSCNDSWGNQTNCVGFTPDGSEGNFSALPRFCSPESDDFTVGTDSPLLPANNSCDRLIGAYGAGCGTVAVEAATWGQVKSLYR